MEEVWLIVKAGVVVFMFVYVLFSFVVMRQVRAMTNTLEVGFEGILNVVAVFHVLVSIGISFAAIILL